MKKALCLRLIFFFLQMSMKVKSYIAIYCPTCKNESEKDFPLSLLICHISVQIFLPLSAFILFNKIKYSCSSLLRCSSSEVLFVCLSRSRSVSLIHTVGLPPFLCSTYIICASSLFLTSLFGADEKPIYLTLRFPGLCMVTSFISLLFAAVRLQHLWCVSFLQAVQKRDG